MVQSIHSLLQEGQREVVVVTTALYRVSCLPIFYKRCDVNVVMHGVASCESQIQNPFWFANEFCGGNEKTTDSTRCSHFRYSAENEIENGHNTPCIGDIWL
jgi:hypothetical protein